MNTVLDFLAVFLLASPSISYFKYQRQVRLPNWGRQHYLVLDDTVWSHARPDLGDLRLYVGDREIPYALAVECGSSDLSEANVRVLQPATVNGKTRFVLDMSEVPEYNRVRLKLSARNFVAHARVEGQDDLHGRQWAGLGISTLYDLTDENFGQ